MFRSSQCLEHQNTDPQPFFHQAESVHGWLHSIPEETPGLCPAKDDSTSNPEEIKSSSQNCDISPFNHSSSIQEKPKRRRISLRWLIISTTLLLLTVTGLAIGLGIGISRQNYASKLSRSSGQSTTASPSSSSSPPTQSSSPSVSSSSAVSTRVTGALACNAKPKSPALPGVLKGSGMAFAASLERINSSKPQTIANLFYQDPNGSLRKHKLLSNNTWIDSSIPAVLPAMSGTSMYATTSLSSDGTTWNLFYIDTDAYAAQLNLKDDTIVFNRHLENNKPGDASNARFTSMLACPFYYSSTNNTNGPIDRTGTLVYYSTNTTSINEYIYKDGWWKYLKNWPNINAQAGMGCFTQANSSIAQLYIYNQVQEVEFWWKDMSHDAEWWHKCEFTIKLDPDEVFLGNDENWFYTKNDNNMVVARDVQQVYNCNSTTAVQEPVLVGNRAALNMTDLTAGQVQGTNGERARFVFYQDTKGNVTGYGRPQNGKWEGGKDVLFC